MDVELGSPAGVLQQRGLGGMGTTVSRAEPVVSPAADQLESSSWIRRQLALSSAELLATEAGESPGIRQAALRSRQSSGVPTWGESANAATGQAGGRAAKSAAVEAESESAKAGQAANASAVEAQSSRWRKWADTAVEADP